MPLKGVKGRMWCLVNLPITLFGSTRTRVMPWNFCWVHRLLVIQSRWADIKKNGQRNHGKDIDHLHDDFGVL